MLPSLPLKAVCLPGETLYVEITEERYQKLIERCSNHAGELAVVFCSDYNDELGTMKSIGCQARIMHTDVCSSGLLKVELLGLKRFGFHDIEEKLNIYYAFGVEILEDVKDIAGTDNLFLEVFDTYKNYLNELEKFDPDMAPEKCLDFLGYGDLFKVINGISMSWENKQQGLEINSIKKRLEFILSCLQVERDMLNFISERSVDEKVASVAFASLN